MAQRDMYLELDGIKGEFSDDLFKDQIEIYSFSWGVSNHGTGGSAGGSGGSKSSFSDLSLTKIADKASTNLFISCATGKHIGTGKLHIRKAGDGQKEFETVNLTEVFVTSWSTSGADGSGIPSESFSLNFSKVEFDYKAQKADGSLDASTKKTYDLKANKAS